jgi:adenylylsulfate kinase
MDNREGWCVWVTGLPGSGKSTVASLLQRKLKAKKIPAQLISIDMLRHAVTPKPTYSEEERDIVYAALVFTAKLLTENGINVIIDATGNRRRYRDQAREQIKKYVEVYLRCPIDLCIQRETQRKNTYQAPKQIYKKGLAGTSRTVPGINVPYEEPTHPELIIETNKQTPERSAQKIFDTITKLYKLTKTSLN